MKEFKEMEESGASHVSQLTRFTAFSYKFESDLKINTGIDKLAKLSSSSSESDFDREIP